MIVSASSDAFSKTKEVSVTEAWSVLQAQPQALLVDVRTEGEWAAGVADLSAVGKSPLLISWKLQPNMTYNPQFAETLRKAVPDQATPLYFLCKSGGRSAEAAQVMEQFGYTHCTNVVGGFEQWKQASLPRRNA